MYVQHLQYTQYGKKDMPLFNVEINAGHIRITKRKDRSVVVFERTDASGDAWYDDKHKKIVDAIHALEAALDEAIDSKEN